MTCPSEKVRAAAFSRGDRNTLEPHLSRCDACRVEWEQWEELRSLARELPYRSPSEAAFNRMEEGLLAQARELPEPTRPFPMKWAVGALAAVLLLGVFVGRGGNGNPGAGFTARAEVTSPPGTVFKHVTQHNETGPVREDEVVRLEEGQVRVDVHKLQPTERFRVIVGDAEVEVRGTSFEVVATRDELISVRVHSGRVDVRPKVGAPVTLTAGGVWDRSQAIALVVPPSPEVPSVLPEEGPFIGPTAADLGHEPGHESPMTTPSEGVPSSQGTKTSESSSSAVVASQKSRSAERPLVASPKSEGQVATPKIPATQEGRTASAPVPGAAREAPSTQVSDTTLAQESPQETNATESKGEISPVTPAIPKDPTIGAAFSEAWKGYLAGEYERASVGFERVAESGNALASDASYWRAMSLGKIGRKPEARQELSRFFARFSGSPRTPDAHVLAGWLELERGDRAAARVHFEAVRQTPGAMGEEARRGLAALSQ